MKDEDVSIAVLRHTFDILIQELYPDVTAFKESHYSLDDILNQLIFEVIKEEYKVYAERHTIQYYLEQYDKDYQGTSRKYTRAVQYAQYYRDLNNDEIENLYGFRISELESQDMSGSQKFSGHQFTEQEFWGYKMQADCKLFNKLHDKTLDNSKNVSESSFRTLFSEYAKQIEELEPPVNSKPESIISRAYAYYGAETHFLTEFLYRITLAAEKFGFPDAIPIDRILSVASITPYIPDTSWCPYVFMADLCILPKWDDFCHDFFAANDDEWEKRERLLIDCKQIKNVVLQKGLQKWVEIMHSCSGQDKVDFITEHYWLWDNTPEFEWTSNRIRYYRKLHAAVMKSSPKPHIR